MTELRISSQRYHNTRFARERYVRQCKFWRGRPNESSPL